MRRVHVEGAEPDVLGLARVRQHLWRHHARHLAIGFAFAVRLGGRPIEVALIRRHTIEVSELSIFVVVVVVFGTSCVGRLVVIVIVTT